MFHTKSALEHLNGVREEACFDGINPPINVRTTLNITSIIAPCIGNVAVISEFILWIIILVGINNVIVVKIPIKPENNPTINVSALNIEDIFDFDAPIALNTPISFVLSNTEI